MILEKAEQTIERFKLLSVNDRVIVAVSGGPDSLAMIYLLNKLKERWKLYLHIAHLHHMLRKDEADQDYRFVEKLAQRLSLPFSGKQVQVKILAREQQLSIEEAARKLRYNFLLQVAKENSAKKIALGHSWDDQAETVLMRFLRGSGISGLRGIPAKRMLDDCLIIRPLIEIKRKEIISFLKNKGIVYRSDSSNSANTYFRNKIRNQLFPLLEKDYNPNIKQLLANLSENLADDFDFLQQMAQKGFRRICSKDTAEGVTISIDKTAKLHKAMQKLTLRLAIQSLKGDVRRIDYRHWKELEDLLWHRPEGSVVDLPNAISATKKNANLVFLRRKLNLQNRRMHGKING